MVTSNVVSDLDDVLLDAAYSQDELFVTAALYTIADIFRGQDYWLLKTGDPGPRPHSEPTVIQ